METRPSRIHFRNEPFEAIVRGRDAMPLSCTPVVYDGQYNCGVGIVFPDGSISVWGLVCPRNLIVAWRATEILRHFGSIGNGTLCHCYYAGERNCSPHDFKRYVEPIVSYIGGEVYDSIMQMPVPDQIIRAILDNQDKERSSPDTYPIIEEVRAGTITWRQEFAEAGLKHPDQIDLEERNARQIIGRFNRLLGSYARSIRADRASYTMDKVEKALIPLVEAGLEKESGPSATLALAGVIGLLASAHPALDIVNMPRAVFYDRERADQMAAALNLSGIWLSRNAFPRWQFWRKRLSVKGAAVMLEELLYEHYPNARQPGPVDVLA